MKKIFAILLLSSLGLGVNAQNIVWNVDPTHTTVKFAVTHLMVSEVEGNFKTYSGKVESPSTDFNNGTVEFAIDVNSINTESADRDKHLMGDEFFNAAKYPKIIFKSTSFKKVAGNKYELIGDLTIRNITKKVTFDVKNNGLMKDPWGNMKAGFKATSKINRKDYDLKWSMVTEAGGMVVSDEVDITVNIELSQAK
ncbi:MAG: YceI family protein [Bacteroidia bacterium]|jgi:polyisoprenoid-binding protein YceI|nr:YceI family protein [Bacteroidota bacterium]MBP7244187.1 YceI family protein [Bacteroidia bacterium]